MIDVSCSDATYWPHLRPIVAAVAPSERGTLYLPDQRAQGIDTDLLDVVRGAPHKRSDRPLLCASWGDAQRGSRRPVVLCEHGMGSRYGDGPLSVGYVGGYGRDHVALFLDPHPTARAVHADRYPDTPGAVIGHPILDAHTPRQRTGRLVVLTGHWDSTVHPAQRSAWPHHWPRLRPVLDELAGDGWQVVGSGHPRGRHKPPNFAHHWERLGLDTMWDFGQVLTEADVVVSDNTSAGPLSAALGVRQVVLSAPWYAEAARRRLWPRWALDVGEEAAEPEQIAAAVRHAYVPDVSAIVPWVGGAAVRAVEAIRRHVL